MQPTDNITFERFDRHAGDAEWKYGPRYDFKIIVDGAHVATFKRNNGRKGYNLFDAGGRAIPGSTIYHKHLGLYVEKQADFFQVARDNLARFPSPSGICELAIADAMIEIEIEIDHCARRSLHEHRMRQHAVDLHSKLTQLSEAAGANITGRLAVSDLDAPLKRAIRDAEFLLGEIDDSALPEEIVEGERWGIRRNIPNWIE